MTGNLLFVGGDLSGIQKFIYNITSKKAMVSLKGRSAYLRQYTDEVCGRILSLPEIPSNPKDIEEMKIYCSGGKFYLQVPDTPSIRKSIDELKHHVETELWEEHRGQLAINIAYVPFRYDGDNVVVEGKTYNIGILWQKMTEKFMTLKNQKFKNELLERYGEFFEVQKVGGKESVCQVTGIEGAKAFDFGFENDEKLTVLPSVKKQIELGMKLRDKQHFKMLEDYAGDTYLGVLRMDIDNLGAKFVRSDFKSMEEYKKFSLALDRFFDGNNGRLHDLQDEDEFRDFLNIVYAGGDDIFVVGRWDKVIDFAAKVKEEFKHYCRSELKENNLSISGGIAIVDAKFPIAKAAELAGEAEDAAKRYNGGKKNAFNMFGESVSWTDEFDKVKKEWKKDMVKCCSEPTRMPRSILHKLMQFNEMRKRGEIRYIWNTAYFLKRFSADKNNKAITAFCDKVQKALFDKQQGSNNYRLLALAARWAELELRFNNSNNNKNE